MPARMYKCKSVAFEFLHNESFSAEQARAKFALKFDSYRYAFCSAQEGILLAYHLAAKFLQVKHDDLSWIRRSKAHFLFTLAVVGEGGHKKTFPRQQPFSRRHQFTHESLVGPCAITKDGFHVYAFFHHHEGATFSNRRFSRIEFHLYILHFFPVNLIINCVCHNNSLEFG